MKKYRLKKEAVPFVLEKHATGIYELPKWEDLGICINALEEVEPAYITAGALLSKHSVLGGWSDSDGGKLMFTIHFPSSKYKEHNEFSKGRIIRKLMDRLQVEINYFYANHETTK